MRTGAVDSDDMWGCGGRGLPVAALLLASWRIWRLDSSTTSPVENTWLALWSPSL